MADRKIGRAGSIHFSFSGACHLFNADPYFSVMCFGTMEICAALVYPKRPLFHSMGLSFCLWNGYFLERFCAGNDQRIF